MNIKTAFRATSYLTVGLLVSRGFRFVQFVIVARFLPKHYVGDYALCYTLAALLVTFSSLGIAVAVTKESARPGGKTAQYMLSGLVTRLGFSVIAALVGVTIALVLPWRAELRQTAILFALTSVPLSVQLLNERLLIIQQRTLLAVLCESGAAILQVALVAGVIIFGYGLIAVAACVLLVQLFLAASTGIIALRQLPRPWPRPRAATCRRILIVGWPIAVYVALMVLYTRADILILSSCKGSLQVATYASALTVVKLGTLLMQPLKKALLPFLAREHGKNPNSLLKVHNTALKVLTAISLPGCFLVTVLSPAVIPALYGPGYAEAVACLQVLVWLLPPYVILAFSTTVLLVADKERLTPVPLFVAVPFSIVMNLIYVPLYGWLGAAVVAVASNLVACVVTIYLSVTFVHRLSLMVQLAKPLVASGAMVAVAVALSAHVLPVQVGIACLIYVVVFFLLRPLKQEEGRILRKLTGR